MFKSILVITGVLSFTVSFASDAITQKIITTKATGEKFEVPGTNTVYQVGPNSKLKIEYQAKKEKAELFRGTVRIRVKKSTEDTKQKEPKLQLMTASSVMGVRGTDFLATSTPLLNESEIIVFEGKVEFTSLMDQKDTRLVSEGQWGGVGGRFGVRTHDLINLPKAALDHFDQTSNFEPGTSDQAK
jgi:ferric-dicitrate binding protein FerR (iron transport regulator)